MFERESDLPLAEIDGDAARIGARVAR